jgi:hypothetical protein
MEHALASFLPYAIPFLTFFLGAALTLFLKRYDRRAANLSIYAQDLSDCATEWYNQLYEIRVDLQSGDARRQISRKIEFYERNRLILPKFLRALEALKKHKEANALVIEANAILDILTIADKRANSESFQGRTMCKSAYDLFGGDHLFLPGLKSKRYSTVRKEVPSLQGKKYGELFSLLDDHVQRINIEAGKVV